MAFKKVYPFHVDPQTTIEQVQNGLKSYQSSFGESPTGIVRKSGDIISIEMMITDGKTLDAVNAKLQSILSKITARKVVPATELGTALPGTSVPLPETSGPGLWDPSKGFLEGASDLLGKIQVLAILVGIVLVVLFALRISR